MIVILDYGIGNLKSILNMIKKAGGNAVISSDVDVIKSARVLILPGVGAFDNGMSKLQSFGFDEVIKAKAKEGTSILGICLGMQLLFERSEEGQSEGLGLIKGKVKKFNFKGDRTLKIPHMGWNVVNPVGNSGLYDTDIGEHRFYFVHSYFAVCDDKSDIDSRATYGDAFTCGVHRKNIFGAQFHPEKSHKFGLKFFMNFLEKVC